ncbi:MAG: NAD(+)/NADH kinase [Candidatus Aenigmarchaeota archaeon]|nr:NAD(+)/NADH kinase [Candidatus Aenigmarchaeota archaeon]
MKIKLVGKEKKYFRDVIINKHMTTSTKPDLVVSCGGDGSILYAARKYPDAMILPTRKRALGRKTFTSCYMVEKALKKILAGEYRIKEELMLQGKFKGKKMFALNEIQIHTKRPTKAVRFRVYVDGKDIFGEVVGDGVVVATPFGSSAYYMSVGGRPFKKGIGIALNNPHNMKREHKVVPENSKIRIKIFRQEAWLASDNNKKMFVLKKGDVVTIRKSKKKIRFVKVLP